MDISAIYHRSDYCQCYAADKDTVVIRLRTGKDVDKAYIFCEDPFINQLSGKKQWSGKKSEMQLEMELENHYIWTFKAKPRYKRLQYYFEVSGGKDRAKVFENRICSKKDSVGVSCQYFKFPWINPGDIIAPPEWVKNTIWYQIMPDRFCKAEGTNTDKRFLKWGKNSSGWDTVYGGNIKGITERLGYLKELGIGGIYLTPVFSSDSYHKYNTNDYSVIDTDFGTEEDIKEMISKAHSLGIRVMLDGVFNHCGSEFFAWKDVLGSGKSSPYYDWFFINDENFIKKRFDTSDGRFYTFSFWSVMPKLNTNNPEVIDYFTKLCLHWVTEWDIDGIRFDVGDEVSHRFIRNLHDKLKPVKPDVFLLGEIWFDSVAWLNGTEYDSVMNYPISSSINDYFKNTALSSKDYMYMINYCLSLYPEQITKVLFNFLDTHDTRRVIDTCGGDVNELLQRLTLLFTTPGTPCVYYGTEIAMTGGEHDTDNRHCMPWDKIDKGYNSHITDEIKKLTALRNNRPELCTTGIRFIHHDSHPRLLHYIRYSDSSRIDVYVNADKKIFTPEITGTILYQNKYQSDGLLNGGVLISESTL